MYFALGSILDLLYLSDCAQTALNFSMWVNVLNCITYDTYVSKVSADWIVYRRRNDITRLGRLPFTFLNSD